MTTREMVYEFQRLIETMSDSFTEQDKPNSETIIRFIDWAYNRYLKDKYLSGRTMKETVEFIKRNSKDLQGLIHEEVIDISSQHPRLLYVSIVYLPLDFMGFLRGDVYMNRAITGETSTDEWYPIQIIDYSELDEILTTELNIPIIEKPGLLIGREVNPKTRQSGNLVESLLVTDKYSAPTKVAITYLQHPVPVSIEGTIEIAEYLHEEIVKLSVEMYIMDYKMRFSTKQPDPETK